MRIKLRFQKKEKLNTKKLWKFEVFMTFVWVDFKWD